MASPYDIGTNVKWTWGTCTATGHVDEVFTHHVTRTIKGDEVTRHASDDESAYLITQDDGDRGLKSHTEVRRA